jgi:hypothetical protein
MITAFTRFVGFGGLQDNVPGQLGELLMSILILDRELPQKRHFLVFCEKPGASTDANLSSEFIVLHPPRTLPLPERE